MKASSRFSGGVLVVWLACALAMAAGTRNVMAQTSQAKVMGLVGSISYSSDGQYFMPLRGGMAVPQGAIVKVGPRAALDLDLGGIAGVVRLTENSVVVLEKLANLEPGAAGPLNLELRLTQGTLLGKSRKVPANGQFNVKVANGIAGIDSGQFRVDAQGIVVLLDGTVIFVQAPASGEPVPYTLRAPPEVYYTAVEQVRPAPKELVREVLNQTRSKLPKK